MLQNKKRPGKKPGRLAFANLFAQQGQQHPRRHRTAYYAGHVGAHGVHQQVIVFIVFQAYFVGYARGHRHGRYARGTDERVDFRFGKAVHQFRQQYARSRGDGERDNAEHQNTQRFGFQELAGLQFGSDRQSQQNGGDVAEVVLQGFGQTLRHAGFFNQVAERQRAD